MPIASPKGVWIDRGGMGAFVPDGQPIIDTEGRLACDSLGFYFFAFWPRRCRNGKIRWLCWLEKHDDGTFTLGNRAF